MISVARGRQFLSHVLPAVIRPLHVLWNQIIGFVFLVFAILAGFKLGASIRQFDGDADSIFRVLLTGIFFIIMAAFGVSSFWRARKISRQ